MFTTTNATGKGMVSPALGTASGSAVETGMPAISPSVLEGASSTNNTFTPPSLKGMEHLNYVCIDKNEEEYTVTNPKGHTLKAFDGERNFDGKKVIRIIPEAFKVLELFGALEGSAYFQVGKDAYDNAKRKDQTIRGAYDRFLKDNPNKEEWEMNVSWYNSNDLTLSALLAARDAFNQLASSIQGLGSEHVLRTLQRDVDPHLNTLVATLKNSPSMPKGHAYLNEQAQNLLNDIGSLLYTVGMQCEAEGKRVWQTDPMAGDAKFKVASECCVAMMNTYDQGDKARPLWKKLEKDQESRQLGIALFAAATVTHQLIGSVPHGTPGANKIIAEASTSTAVATRNPTNPHYNTALGIIKEGKLAEQTLTTFTDLTSPSVDMYSFLQNLFPTLDTDSFRQLLLRAKQNAEYALQVLLSSGTSRETINAVMSDQKEARMLLCKPNLSPGSITKLKRMIDGKEASDELLKRHLHCTNIELANRWDHSADVLKQVAKAAAAFDVKAWQELVYHTLAKVLLDSVLPNDVDDTEFTRILSTPTYTDKKGTEGPTCIAVPTQAIPILENLGKNSLLIYTKAEYEWNKDSMGDYKFSEREMQANGLEAEERRRQTKVVQSLTSSLETMTCLYNRKYEECNKKDEELDRMHGRLTDSRAENQNLKRELQGVIQMKDIFWQKLNNNGSQSATTTTEVDLLEGLKGPTPPELVDVVSVVRAAGGYLFSVVFQRNGEKVRVHDVNVELLRKPVYLSLLEKAAGHCFAYNPKAFLEFHELVHRNMVLLLSSIDSGTNPPLVFLGQGDKRTSKPPNDLVCCTVRDVNGTPVPGVWIKFETLFEHVEEYLDVIQTFLYGYVGNDAWIQQFKFGFQRAKRELDQEQEAEFERQAQLRRDETYRRVATGEAELVDMTTLPGSPPMLSCTFKHPVEDVHLTLSVDELKGTVYWDRAKAELGSLYHQMEAMAKCEANKKEAAAEEYKHKALRSKAESKPLEEAQAKEKAEQMDVLDRIDSGTAAKPYQVLAEPNSRKELVMVTCVFEGVSLRMKLQDWASKKVWFRKHRESIEAEADKAVKLYELDQRQEASKREEEKQRRKEEEQRQEEENKRQVKDRLKNGIFMSLDHGGIEIDPNSATGYNVDPEFVNFPEENDDTSLRCCFKLYDDRYDGGVPKKQFCVTLNLHDLRESPRYDEFYKEQVETAIKQYKKKTEKRRSQLGRDGAQKHAQKKRKSSFDKAADSIDAMHKQGRI